jgi:hypothetical protein
MPLPRTLEEQIFNSPLADPKKTDDLRKKYGQYRLFV